MRVFLDENVPRRLRRVLDDHHVSTVDERGWKGTSNGALLALIEADYDVIVTADGSLTYQNDLEARALSMIILPTPKLALLVANATAIRQSLSDLARMAQPAIITVGWDGRRRYRPLGSKNGVEIDLPPVATFAPDDR